MPGLIVPVTVVAVFLGFALAVRRLESTDCMRCGSCVDVCPESVIRLSFSSGRDA